MPLAPLRVEAIGQGMFAELVKIPLRHGRAVLSEVRSEFRQMGAASKLKGIKRLQLGAGEHPLPGWGNLDLSGDSITWDLTKPIPVPPNSVQFVYSEHFIEHVSREQLVKILANCFVVMAAGAVIRLSTPDLAKVVDDYRSGNVVQMPHGDWFPETPAQMLNEALHLWGHQFVYDEPELTVLLATVGFSNIKRVSWRVSDHPDLKGLESRPDFGDLIMEATK